MKLTSAEYTVENSMMMGREDARNMQSFVTELTFITGASGWLFKKKSITMHGNMKVNLVNTYREQS